MEYTYKLLAALLDYPTELTVEIVNEIDQVIKDCKLLDEQSRIDIVTFADTHRNMRLLEWQQAYSSVFDVAPITSLYLFEHVYGSSRKRGAAMSSLKETYAEHGLEISNQELPDYLPVYLDFISTLDDEREALNYLADIGELIKSIYESLTKHESDYALLLKPLIALAAKGESHPLPETESAENNCPFAK